MIIVTEELLERKLAALKEKTPVAMQKVEDSQVELDAALSEEEAEDVDLELYHARNTLNRLNFQIDELSMHIMTYPHSPDGQPLSIKGIYGMHSVQADGYLDGTPFYFRSCGTHWGFYISASVLPLKKTASLQKPITGHDRRSDVRHHTGHQAEVQCCQQTGQRIGR